MTSEDDRSGPIASGSGRPLTPATTSDVENFLESTQIAIVFLDNDLRVMHFTRAITQLLHLVETTSAGRSRISRRASRSRSFATMHAACWARLPAPYAS